MRIRDLAPALLVVLQVAACSETARWQPALPTADAPSSADTVAPASSPPMAAVSPPDGPTPSAPDPSIASANASGPASAATPAAPTAAALPPPDPLHGKSLLETCNDRGLSLIRWDLDVRMARDICCGPGGQGEDECQYDWPFSDLPPCSTWAEIRNEIFARYGYPFKEQRWRDRFSAQPWYQRREDFDSLWMTPEARANVAAITEKERLGLGCTKALPAHEHGP